MIGTTLSHFKITAKLGEGGMGEVYQAEDRKLGREVAIKVLPEAVASDPERLARFEREAKVLASLNHPNVAAIYSFESAESQDPKTPRPQDPKTPRPQDPKTPGPQDPKTPGPGTQAPSPSLHFLVMELVEGETLSARIARGPLPFDEAGEIVLQVSEALEAAHARGIIHRDLKPGNVMVTREGRAKVLDFGLAKRQIVEAEADQDAPTATMHPVTRENQIIGTIPYMSPEQIRSQPLDPSSDLFSLGVMWFEMITGKRPFDGDTSVDLISSILKEETPDLSALRPDTPATLRALIEDCLVKPPDRRLGSATTLRQRLSSMMGASWKPEPSSSDISGGSDPQIGSRLDPSVIAVLPFDNLSGAEDAEFLATGLHNDLITELSRIEGLTVISRSSVIRYRETEKTPGQIGHELSAGTLVEGTVQSIGDRVRLTAQLIDSAENAQKWAERYDRELSTETLFDLQSDVTRKIVDSMQSKLAPTLEIPRGKAQTHDMEAYRLVTLGRVQVERRTEVGCRRAIEHFQAALERDPEYAPAWAGLAEALAASVWYGYSERGDRLERAQRAARRAVELDPDSAEAHTSLGYCLGAVRNGPAAVRELEWAVELQPSSWDAHSLLSYLHHFHARARDSYARAKRAVELNPLSAEAVNHLSLSSLMVDDPKAALKEAQRASELSPGWTTATLCEGLALRDLGRYDEAATLLEHLSVEWAGLGAQATLALTHQAAGDEAMARRVLASMGPDVDAFAVGIVHLALGEIETAFQRFDEAEHLTDWACLAVHHLYRDVWAPVDEDSRYRELVKRAFEAHGFEPPAGDSND